MTNRLTELVFMGVAAHCVLWFLSCFARNNRAIFVFLQMWCSGDRQSVIACAVCWEAEQCIYGRARFLE